MFPLSRSKESKSGDRYDSGQEKDVEENESIDGEIDVDVDVEEEDLDHGDRTFVTDTDTNRKRGTFVKILSTAALGLLTFGAFFGASYGVSTAVQRSQKNKTPENMEEAAEPTEPAGIPVDLYLSMSPTAGIPVDLYLSMSPIDKEVLLDDSYPPPEDTFSFAYQGSKSSETSQFQECQADCDTCDPGPTKDDCCGSCGQSEYCCKNGESRPATGPLILTAVIDGPLPGGLPKAVEIAVLADVSDLSIYGIGAAYNGGSSSGVDCQLSGSALAGTYITVSKESAKFQEYFGSTPSNVCGSFQVNGDDVVELFENDVVIDAYGDVETDGTNTAWEYMDGFAYRLSGSTIDGTVFDVAEWSVSGVDAMGGCTSNSACTGSVVPMGQLFPQTTECKAYGTTCGISTFVVDVNGQICLLAEADGQSGTYLCDQGAKASKSSKGSKFQECQADCDTCDPGPTKDDCCGSCGQSEYCCKNGESRPATGPLILTAVIDGPLPGGLPKAVEIAVLADVSDLSIYGIGAAYNGGSSSGVDCQLSGSALAGTYITVSKESAKFQEYFGSAPSNVCDSFQVNGDDVVELFENDVVIDAYGDVETDGTNTAWEYMDGFAYRLSGSTNDVMLFDVAEWSVSGVDAMDGCTSNSACTGSVVPMGQLFPQTTECKAYGTTCGISTFVVDVNGQICLLAEADGQSGTYLCEQDAKASKSSKSAKASKSSKGP
ncbi:hypothetical protein THAOC_31259 [Thalassiosira oceanica]|uniref:Uncharacterized protein n=1 Tax=Thalassiosira oceanica TaxID=159749 RepID=K0RLN8_THAOC|nr:hypothetical protein THAOC_31259 [Thalassiosira oceanica]|eukprot:EJK49826.1 hypothetical protein THAOC_31259 [Thalassiosira oceanica]